MLPISPYIDDNYIALSVYGVSDLDNMRDVLRELCLHQRNSSFADPCLVRSISRLPIPTVMTRAVTNQTPNHVTRDSVTNLPEGSPCLHSLQ